MIRHDGIVLNDAELRAAARAESQCGLIAYSDLIAAGLTSPAIARRTRQGTLIRRRPGVYAFAGTPRLEQQRLVEEALSVGSRAAISHDTAGHLWGLVARETDRIHIVVRRWRREHRTTAVVHESLDFVPSDRQVKDGIPITSAVRTVVDLGATSKWLVESALSRGLRSQLFTLEEVEQFVRRVQRRGRRGVGAIRPFLESHRASDRRTESVLEDKFLRLLHERGLSTPESQFEVRDHQGFICRADFAYPRERLLVELDGAEYHSDPEAFQSDRSKQNRTQAAGWTTLRFTWSDVTQRPDYTAATVRRTLLFLRN